MFCHHYNFPEIAYHCHIHFERSYINNMELLGCEPIDGVLSVPGLNQINFATFSHQIGDTYKNSNIYLI